MFWTISGLSVGCVSMISQMPTGWQEFLAQSIQTALVGGNEQAIAWDTQGYTAAKFHRRDTPHHGMLPYCCHMLPIAGQDSQSQAWMAWDSQQGCCWIYIPKSLSICQLQMGRAPSMHVSGLASRCRWCWSSPVGAARLLCQAVACAAGPVHYILPSSDAKSGLAQQENHFPNLSSGCPLDFFLLCVWVEGYSCSGMYLGPC